MSAKTFLSRTALVVALLTTVGCAEMTKQQQLMLSGAAVGTTVGAISTVMLGGCVACGAAIGGAVGTGAGYVMNEMNLGLKSFP